MKILPRSLTLVTALALCASLQGCFAAAAAAGGAAGGYEAQKHGYGVQSPVKKDSAGGYRGQNPVTHDPSKDQTNPANENRTDNGAKAQ
ncbi:MAG: hypothetical protein PF501_02270 [Salinisphaera sp.]|jgi:osmotically-inducible protein OsmY|nr:hypothetical protein [Salinisphaera sp.]